MQGGAGCPWDAECYHDHSRRGIAGQVQTISVFLFFFLLCLLSSSSLYSSRGIYHTRVVDGTVLFLDLKLRCTRYGQLGPVRPSRLSEKKCTVAFFLYQELRILNVRYGCLPWAWYWSDQSICLNIHSWSVCRMAITISGSGINVRNRNVAHIFFYLSYLKNY